MKKWTYRFKRGLASFLAVGMIAGGVSGATCLPVYAAESETAAVAAIDNLDDLKKAVYAGLKEQILGIYSGNDSEVKTGFTVSVDFKNQGSNKNREWQDSIINDLDGTLKKIRQECPTEMFWYDTDNENLNHCTGTGVWEEKNDIIHAKFEFGFAVKKAYRPKDSTDSLTMSVQTIRDTKNAMSDGELDKVIDGSIYNGLKDEISKMVNGQDAQKTEASFTVIVDNCNSDITAALGKRLEKRVPEIVSRLTSQCASEIFWYDEQSKIRDQDPCYVVTTYSEQNNQAWYTFCFAVKEEYRSQNDKNNARSLDVKKVQDAKKKIDTLLDNKDMSDYEILCKYRDALCEYSDPVKGFQYFCDQTFGTTGKTRCCTVTGKIVKDGLESPHTWNIVRIDDKNYLVDMENHASSRSGEFFLVGAQYFKDGPQSGTYVIANGTKYIPDDYAKPINPVPTSPVKYLPKQKEFHIVDSTKKDTEKAGGSFMVQATGNVPGSAVKFESSNPSVATVSTSQTESGEWIGLVQMIKAGQVTISATSSGTDLYQSTTDSFSLTVIADQNNTGGTGGTGGNTGGSGSSGDIGGIGGGTGGSGGTGSVTTTVSSGPGELLPQIDFCLNSGTATILKSVGAEDFTITASGQVKDSTVTYASSDPSVATVDANTGTVHIVGSGTAVISATASKTTLHREEKCEYKLEVH